MTMRTTGAVKVSTLDLPSVTLAGASTCTAVHGLVPAAGVGVAGAAKAGVQQSAQATRQAR
jgi:hypothetical protein